MPCSSRGCPDTPSAAAAAATVASENVPSASNPHASPEPPSVPSPLAVNTVRPPHHGYISFASAAMLDAGASAIAISGTAASRPAPPAEPLSNEIAGAAVTVSGALLSPYA